MKTNYTFPGKNRITSTLLSGNNLWIAFLGSDSLCTIYKSSVFNPNLVYWNINTIGDEITSMIEDNDNIYLSLDYSLYIGTKLDKLNPSTISYFIKDIGIIEKAIDLVDDSTYIYFLIPGIASGTNSKIVKYNKSTLVYVETIDLGIISGDTVTNASKIDIDKNGVLWVVSDVDSIPTLTKVYYDGSWNYNSTILS